MRLRNKKTGEIVDVDFIYPETAEFFYPNFKLVDFNELFEDYEEPKEYWAIDCFSPDGELVSQFSRCSERIIENRKQIGNYFSSREEAEKAAEHLRAWKRLKDKGFRFDGFYDKSKQHILWHCGLPYITDDEFYKDLDLLFLGGEE